MSPHERRHGPPTVGAVVLVLGLALTGSSCHNEDRPSRPTYATIADLHEALNGEIGIDCDPLSDLTAQPEIRASFRSRFPTLAGLGACSADGLLALRVFDNAPALDDFVSSGAWVTFEGVYHCLEDGDVLRSAAGANWMIVNAGDPTIRPKISPQAVSALNASLIQSAPVEDARCAPGILSVPKAPPSLP